MLSNIISEGIIGVWRAKEGLDREKNGSNLKSRGPLILKNVKADATKLVDVGMVDLRQKANFGRLQRVILSQEQLKFKNTTYKIK